MSSIKIINTKIENNKKEKSEIICPECLESIKIYFDNYKINLYECKNGHERKNVLLNDYLNIEKESISKIVCGKCHNKIDFKELFKCNFCNINICKTCKSFHDINHGVVEYKNKNYICNLHIRNKYSYNILNTKK